MEEVGGPGRAAGGNSVRSLPGGDGPGCRHDEYPFSMSASRRPVSVGGLRVTPCSPCSPCGNPALAARADRAGADDIANRHDLVKRRDFPLEPLPAGLPRLWRSARTPADNDRPGRTPARRRQDAPDDARDPRHRSTVLPHAPSDPHADDDRRPRTRRRRTGWWAARCDICWSVQSPSG